MKNTTKPEILGSSIGSILKAIKNEVGNEVFILFENYGFKNVDENKWYSLSDLIVVLFEIESVYGAYTLFSIGKLIPQNILMPEGLTSLEIFVSHFDSIYQLNHRGEAGDCKIVDHDTKNGVLHFELSTPYPCEFERGVLTSFVRKLTKVSTVDIDYSKPCRRKGAKSTCYIVDYLL